MLHNKSTVIWPTEIFTSSFSSSEIRENILLIAGVFFQRAMASLYSNPTSPERENDDFQGFPASLIKELEDEQYETLEKWFTAKGRGRRVNLPLVDADYRLFLQLHLLRIKNEKTWHFVEDIICRLLPLSNLRPVEFRGILDRCVGTMQKSMSDENNYKTFLDQNALKLPPLIDYISRSGVVITSDDLRDLDSLRSKLTENAEQTVVTKEFVVKLERFRTKENFQQSYTFEVLECFGVMCVNQKKGRKMIGMLLSDYERKRKSRYKLYGEEPFERLCNEIFDFSPKDVSPTLSGSVVTSMPSGTSDHSNAMPRRDECDDNSCDQVRILPSTSSPGPSEPSILIPSSADACLNQSETEFRAKLGMELKAARGRIQEIGQENADVVFKLKVLTEENVQKQGQLVNSQNEAKVLHRKHTTVVEERNQLRKDLAECQAEVTSIRRTNFYKRLKRKETELSAFEKDVEEHRQSCSLLKENVKTLACDIKCKDSEIKSKNATIEKLKLLVEKHDSGKCAETLTECKQRIKSLQTSVSDQKQVNTQLRDHQKALKEKTKQLTSECDTHILTIDELKERSVSVKEGNRYSDDIIKCTIQLIGEVGIAAHKCSTAIQCVSKCIYDEDIKLEDLPSLRTSLRHADRGAVIAQMHLAETLQSTKYDLHTDGTGRDGRKWVGNQATLASGDVMSMGYSTVVTEDTETLVDVAVSLLQELGDVFAENDDEKNRNFHAMLENMVSLMSDRASVMKSFNRAFQEKRQQILGDTSTQLQFLYCSAHFLLGLSHEGEKALKDVQKHVIGTPVGRDVLPVFRSFKGAGESAVSRLVRTCCDVLGPRGDDKNGCREAWEAFCDMKGKKSHIKSYRSNRFNNFFESAAAIHYHRHDILEFFSKFSTNLNLKLQSVQADLKSDEVDSMLAAVGIMYFVVTGPYWCLICSKTEYLDLYKFMEPMTQRFDDYAKDASPLMEKMTSIIPDFAVVGQDCIAHSLTTVPKEDLLLASLQKLFAGFHAVAKRQLDDFLPNGQYYNVQDPELRAKMQHCQLTNLTGEANLADLDFSLFNKRHASLHYRSFINMMNRNRSMSTWFHKKSTEDQKKLLSLSAQKSSELRLKHRQKEQAVRAKWKEKVKIRGQEIEKKHLKATERKAKITSTVKENGGPCTKPSDVDTLVNRFHTIVSRKAALNAEIQFQKCVLGAKDPTLKTAKLTCEDIAKNLQRFLLLREERCDNDSPTRNPVLVIQLPTTSTAETTHDELEAIVDNEMVDSDEIENAYDVDTDTESVTNNEIDETDDEDDFTEDGGASVTGGPDASGFKQADDEPPAKKCRFGSFRFSNQGMWVAVVYDSPTGNGSVYYVGQVLTVKSPEIAAITFMEGCGLKKNLFRFPTSPDFDEDVNAKFVCHSDFPVGTNNGRTWSLTTEDLNLLEDRFRNYMRCSSE